MKATRSKMLYIYFFISAIAISCGSNDNIEMEPVVTEPELGITIGDTFFQGDLSESNSAFTVTTNPALTWTSVSFGGSTTTGETISFILAFQGKQAGSSTISGAAGEDTDAPEGLSLALITSNGEEPESVVYKAVNVRVNITAYQGISGVTAEVSGTFSGTVSDEEDNQFDISGTFSTGVFE